MNSTWNLARQTTGFLPQWRHMVSPDVIYQATERRGSSMSPPASVCQGLCVCELKVYMCSVNVQLVVYHSRTTGRLAKGRKFWLKVKLRFLESRTVSSNVTWRNTGICCRCVARHRLRYFFSYRRNFCKRERGRSCESTHLDN